MSEFRKQYREEFLKHSPVDESLTEDFRIWTKNIFQWLMSTEHISVEYFIQYEETDIDQLSPGIRGIVLLLFYLAIDGDNDQPLIIDQPEENLDPKSIFEELVPIIRKAKLTRQIIIVTHNANLVINTDADQIIIAESEKKVSSEIPTISYTIGALENKDIRELACKILEGGREAFRNRAKRLRIKI